MIYSKLMHDSRIRRKYKTRLYQMHYRYMIYFTFKLIFNPKFITYVRITVTVWNNWGVSYHVCQWYAFLIAKWKTNCLMVNSNCIFPPKVNHIFGKWETNFIIYIRLWFFFVSGFGILSSSQRIVFFVKSRQ